MLPGVDICVVYLSVLPGDICFEKLTFFNLLNVLSDSFTNVYILLALTVPSPSTPLQSACLLPAPAHTQPLCGGPLISTRAVCVTACWNCDPGPGVGGGAPHGGFKQ